MNIIDSVTKDYKKQDVPAFNVGDTVRVHVKIVEGQRERIQVFEGYVLKKQNGGISETFTRALVLRRHSLYTLQRLQRLNS